MELNLTELKYCVMKIKICKNCKKKFILNYFQKYKVKNKKGIRNVCKFCCNEQKIKWTTNNKEYKNQHRKLWRKNNPLFAKAENFQNTLRKYGLTLSLNKIRKWIKTQKLICGICNKKLNLNKICLDHKISISNGGSVKLQNCHLVHKKCNLIKGRKNLNELRTYVITT